MVKFRSLTSHHSASICLINHLIYDIAQRRCRGDMTRVNSFSILASSVACPNDDKLQPTGAEHETRRNFVKIAYCLIISRFRIEDHMFHLPDCIHLLVTYLCRCFIFFLDICEQTANANNARQILLRCGVKPVLSRIRHAERRRAVLTRLGWTSTRGIDSIHGLHITLRCIRRA